jgi:hypothetical protein
MAANLNNNVIINILKTAGAVARAEFGLICYASNDVVFASGVHKVFESIAAVRADAEIQASTQAAAAGEAFFGQTAHPPQWMVCEVTDEATPGSGELTDSLDAAFAAQPFYCLCLQSRVLLQIQTADGWVASNYGQQFAQSSDAPFLAGTADATNIGWVLDQAATNRTMLVYRETDTDELTTALAAQFFVVDPDVGTTTLARQTATGFAADDITDTEKANILGVNANVYLNELDNPIVFPGTMGGGDFCDATLSGDWFAARARERITQDLQDKAALKLKVPYTQAGMQDLSGNVTSVQDQGEDESVGHFKPGSSTITVPKLSTISAAVRTSRAYTFSASSTLAGAIQTVTVNITVLNA